MSATRIIHLRDGSVRQRSSNTQTHLTHRPTAAQTSPTSCEVAFITAYPTIRRICTLAQETSRERCLAVFAIDPRGVAAHALLKTRSSGTRRAAPGPLSWVRPRRNPHGIQTAIVGRHTEVDLCLPDDPELSLRHLAIVLHPDHGQALRFQVLDLRTPLGIRDERGHRVEHVAADGPMFLQLGTYALLFLPLDGRLSWPLDPLEAWHALPPRDYTTPTEPGDASSGAQATPSGGVTGPLPAPSGEAPGAQPVPTNGATGVQILRGPRFARRGLGGAERQRGQLSVRSADGTSSFVLGAHALRSGVLLGRYDRCDNAGLSVLSDHRVSRVHLLLLEIDDALYAIDTASTNGVWIRGSGIRHRCLDARQTLELGSRLAHVTWSPGG